MRLLVTGGGTGGHVYPLVAVLQHLAAARVLELTNSALYIGRAGSIEERIARELGIAFLGINVGGLRSLGIGTQLQNLRLLARAVGDASRAIAHFKPDAILATGGYVSAPVIWAARNRKVPVVIELPDLEPGWAIKALWRFSRQVAVSFDEVLGYFPRGRATVTGYPVRREFFEATKSAAQVRFELDANVPTVTIFGGSQGAHILNETVRTNLRPMLEFAQLVHISGTRDFAEMQAARNELSDAMQARYRLFEYLDDGMPLALKAADVIVARAGAATLGEFPAVGVASILVPGLFAAGHQEKNADFMAAHGASLKMMESQLPNEFVPTLRELTGNRERLERMAQAARAMARPDAPERIAELLL